MEIRLVETELFQVDVRRNGRTDRHNEANSSFSQFFERVYKSGVLILKFYQFLCVKKPKSGPADVTS
jgi:hypothetical protein